MQRVWPFATRLLLAVFFLAMGPLPSALAVTATDGRLAGDDQRTRLVVDFDKTTTVKAFALADPYRIVVDLPGVTFKMPAGTADKGRGLVSGWRYGRIAPDRSRIVIDLAKPAAVDKVYVLDALDTQPARLVVDLVETDRDTFLKTVAIQRQSGTGADGTVTQPPVGAAAKGDRIVPGQIVKPLVVIDPGHGGIDSGAVTPGGDLEKAIVLDFALALAARINASGQYRSLLTRADDSFVSLRDRVRIARDSGAALLVSIHADALSDPFGVRGATIYTLSEKASDEAAARYAERENQADAIAGLDLSTETDAVADILIDMTRRETKAYSVAFARTLADELRSAATLNKNPLRSAGFIVLKAHDVPSVLLELGYLSNPDDVKLLTSVEWRERASEAAMKAIDSFLRARDTVGMTPAAIPATP